MALSDSILEKIKKDTEDKKGVKSGSSSKEKTSGSTYISQSNTTSSKISDNIRERVAMDVAFKQMGYGDYLGDSRYDKYIKDAVDGNFVNSVLSDWSKYATDVNSASKGLNWSTATSGEYDSIFDSGNDIRDRALASQYYLYKNKSNMDESRYKEIYSYLDSIIKNQPDTMSWYSGAKDVYSKFKSQEEYDKALEYYNQWGKYQDEEDFEEYKTKGASVSNPSWDDSKAPVEIFGWKPFGDGSDVINMVAFAEANKDKAELASVQAARSGVSLDEETKLVNAINLYMKPEEKGIYNYLIGKGETQKASEYLEELKDTLTQREAGRIVEQVDSTALEAVFSAIAGVDSFVSGVKNLDNYILGTEADPTTSFQYAHQAMSSNNKNVWKFVNDFSYTTGNMLPSILVGTITGGVGGAVTMGASATGNAYAQMRNLGYDEWQSRGYATLVGASEGALSYLLGGISKLGGGGKGIFQTVAGKLVPKFDNAIARVAIQVGGNMLDEGLEEAIQTVLEPAFKALMTGEDFEAPEWEEVFYSALLGAVSAGVLEGIQSVVETSAQIKQAGNTGRAIMQADGGVEALKNLANEVAGVSEAEIQQKLTRQADNVSSEVATGKGLQKLVAKAKNASNATKVGNLYNTVQTANNLYNASANQADIAKSLERKGFNNETANDIASALVASYNGQELTKAQVKLLKSAKDSKVVQDAISNIITNEKSTMGQRSQNIRGFQEDIKTGIISRAYGISKDTLKEMSKGNLPTEEKKVSDSSYEVSEEGKTLVDGQEVKLNGLRITEDGAIVVATGNNKTADPSKVTYPSKGHALVYENYANIETTTDNPVIANMDVADRSALAMTFEPDSGISAKEQFLGLNHAYYYGFDGISLNEKTVSPETFNNITEKQRNFAYELGRKAGEKAAKTQGAGIQAAYEKAVEKLGGKEAAAAVAKKNEGKVILDDNIKESTMTKKQRASYKMAEIVAKAVSTDIHVYHGMKEYGKYDPTTGEIWLNINGQFSGSTMMAFTLGHELGHLAKQWSPDEFKDFADYLLKQYGKKGVSVESLIQAQIANAKANGYTLNEHEAYEEVIADACMRMLLDSDALQKMAGYKAENPSNWQKIVDAIKKFITNIRNLFKGAEPDSVEAALFKELDEAVKVHLEEKFVNMVLHAGEHMSTIRNAFGKGTVVEVNADGEFTLAKGNVDGATKFLYNGFTWESGGRETLQSALKAEGFSNEDIKAALTIMDGKHDLVKQLAEQFPEQDRINQVTVTTDIKDGHSVLSALVSNGDYPVNIDLLMVCKKRKAYQRVINRLCETGMIQQATVDALAIAEINKILGKYGFETACLGCFVESRRLRIQEWANTIVKEWNAEVKKRNPNAKAFGFGKGEATLTPDEVMKLVGELESGGEKNDQGNLNLGQGSAVKRMGVLLDKVPSLRKTLSVEDLITPDGLTALRKFDSNLFSMVKSRYGSNSPKFVQEFNPYNHELAMYGTVPSEYKSLREYLYAIGGARMQSFSDFIVENWFDYCQIVADLSARKLPMHTYTKEIALAKLFGLTGIKINMSLIPDIDRSLGKEFAGLTRNAKGELELIWADKDRYKATGGKSYMQSINFADAIALQNDPRYSGNVGTIAVGVSDKHILMMLDDNRIRMIIPYHSSGMNPIFADLMGTSFYKDYTMFQNTTVKQLYNSKGEPVSLKLDKTQTGKLTSGFQFNAVLQELGDARAAAQAYKDWCADASKHTITINGETYTAELTPKFDSFSWHDNYYKLLEDFNTYDCITEEAARQGDVQQTYPEDFDKILKDELTVQEKHRQKQEESKAFDNAMGEIESYLSMHSKADTVFYAEQHGIKLAAKDKKLGAEDKKKLADLRKGMKMSMPKVAAPTFYSQMANVVDGVKQEKLGAASVVSMLRGKGVKAEEIKWSGIEAWLEGKKSVTKAELQEFIAGSMLQIEEEVLDNKDRPYTEDQKERLGEYKAKQDEVTKRVADEWKKITGKDLPISIRNAATESGVVNAIIDANKEYKDATFEGRLLKKLSKDLNRVIMDNDYFGFDSLDDALLSIHRHRRDFIKNIDASTNDKAIIVKYCNALNAYNELPNRISDADTDKLRAIARECEQWNRKMAEVMREHDKEQEKYMTKWGKYTLKGGKNYREMLFRIPGSTYSNDAMYGHWGGARGVLAHARVQDMDTFIGKMLFVEEIQSDWHNEGHKTEYQDVPDAPFKDTYHEYVMKRLLRMAADEGYDSIGWTTADVQMKRWNPQRKTNAQMGITDAKNPNAVAFEDGYRIEYDQDIPKFLSKYGKKWGTSVGKTVLDNGTEVWSMAITDAMKDSVLYEGQPKYSMPKVYDSSKPFADQVDDWLNGTFPEIDTLLVGGTPDVLKKIGLPSLPITIAQRNLKDNLLGYYRGSAEEIADHLITPDEMKDLPAKIADPVAIIVDRRLVRGQWKIQESAIDILVEMEINGKNAIVPIRMNGNSVRNGVQIDANVIASIHGNRDTLDRLDYALRNDSDDNVMVFYVNKKKTTAVLRKAGYTITGWPNISDGFIHSISDPGSPVKLRIHSQTETRQFKNWFKGSKVVNEDGTPRIVYHYTDAEFWTFDTERSGSNQGKTLGDGIYISTSPDMFSYAGKNRMELYAVIRNPFEMKLTKKQATYVLETYAAKKHNLDQYNGLYRNHAMEKLTSPIRVFDYLAQYAAENGIKVSDILKDLGYDGVHSGSEWVAFDANQVKSATDNIGTFDGDNTDIRYKSHNSHGMSPRQLLADAFDELVQTPDERKLMDQYRNNIAKVEDVQERLRKLRGEISKLTKSNGDKAKIADMNKTAKELAELIDKYDRKLLDLEASKPLKDVLARAKTAAYQEARQRSEKDLKEYRQQVSERFDRGVEGRRKTEMRKKIRKVIRDLDKILNRGDKKRNVKEDMKDFVAEALAAAEVLFTDNYTNEDIVRNGFGVELSKEETKYLEESRKYMDELANLPVGGFDAWQARQEAEEQLKSKLAYRMSKLKDAFFRERQRLNKAEVAEVLGNLADAYAKLETSEYSYVNGAYHESVYQYLKMLQDDVGGAKIKDMTLGQLEELHKAYTMVLTTVQNANKMFADDLKQSKEELANRVMMEVYQAGGEHGLWSKGQLARNQASWNNTKPIYAAERTGSSTFVKLVNGLFKGQYNWATDMAEAKDFRQKIAQKYGFKNWDMEKTYKFTSSSGIEFELNLDQIMSLYAYAKREQAHEHLLKGGFVFGKNTEVVVNEHGIKRTYLNKSAKAHNISDEIMGEIVSKLSDEQKGFVDEMQDYLSTTMGNKGNEVSMRLYGVKLFMEKFYFPLRSAGQFKEKAKEAELKQQQGQISIVNSGFTKAVTPKASNPVVLDGFTDVWAGHVNEMSLYHSMVLPMEDFRRVYNYASPNMEGQESASVNSFIENAYGDAATGYFDHPFQTKPG